MEEVDDRFLFAALLGVVVLVADGAGEDEGDRLFPELMSSSEDGERLMRIGEGGSGESEGVRCFEFVCFAEVRESDGWEAFFLLVGLLARDGEEAPGDGERSNGIMVVG